MPSNIAIRPATLARFPDVAIMVGPKNPDSSVCWCLSHRLDAKTNRALVGRARGEYVKQLCRRRVAPGVLAYEDHDVVGWAAVAPRSELPFARSTKIPHIDDQPVWSVWCIRVRPGHRGIIEPCQGRGADLDAHGLMTPVVRRRNGRATPAGSAACPLAP